MEKLADLYGCDAYSLYEEDADVMESMLATAFRVNDLSPEDMKQVADFKRVVKNYLKMEVLLEKRKDSFKKASDNSNVPF